LKKIGLTKIPSHEGNIIAMTKTLLIESVKEITRCIRGMYKKSNKESNCKIAVLFSGGIDSTLIARLLDINLPK